MAVSHWSPLEQGSPVKERQPLSMKERAEATRRRLLDAAENVIGEKGFFRASISEITRTAGVAQGTFYIYFKTKEDIFRELVHTLSHDLRRDLQEAVAPITDRRKAERVALQTFFRFVTRRRNLYAVIRECEFVDPQLYHWYYERLAEGYARGLRQGMARGQIRPLNPEVVAYALMGAFQFVGMRWILREDSPPLDEVAESLMDLLFHGLDSSTGPAEASQSEEQGAPSQQ